MLGRNSRYALALYLGTLLILLVPMLYSAPVSGAYLTWEATAGPNSLAVNASVANKGATLTPVPVQPTKTAYLPTDAAAPEETPLPSPAPAPPTEIEMTLGGVGIFDEASGSYGVAGMVCVLNSGANPTEGISPLQLQVYEVAHDQNAALVPGAYRELAISAPLVPGQSRCMYYQLLFPPTGVKTYQIAGSVTITNYQGWQPFSENCPGQSVCPFGPVEKAEFVLPVIATQGIVAPTEAPLELPTQVPTETPSHTPTGSPTQDPTVSPP